MEITVREYKADDVAAITAIWNDIVEGAESFPQEYPFEQEEAAEFFAAQTFTGVAFLEGEVAGFYILHPNNVGRCAHTANASYGVKASLRGCGIGEKLVLHSLAMCEEKGFEGLQFNAVLCSNHSAIKLYEKLGFERLGTVKKGYRRSDGNFEGICLFYKSV